MINVCIHGHFYQPPRENPWSGEIELQPGAKPYHDWNERIYHECYKPNSEAEIVNDKGDIVKRVNNYEHINFNFGPALLAWIKRKHPDTYNKIIEADKQSIKTHNGHGNAIAMCYNHMIMPLANYNDKITQVRWGLADFKYHFGRDSEGIWLPETACNHETIEVLINERIRYIIMDSSQADKIRKSGAEQWQDVAKNGIDPRHSYKCYSKIKNHSFINIFFYDGPVSKAVAFDDVLMNSANLLNKIFHAVKKEELSTEQLISVATDGETFGHHKKFTERTLAYFLTGLAPENNLKIVNFGEYLEMNNTEYEVMIKEGTNVEGTSWSCPHGVERWKDDCGCGRTGDWNQKWRKPLRESLDWLRDRLIEIYQEKGSLYLKDIWKARNEYIKVILNNTNDIKNEFIINNSVKKLSDAEAAICFKLLEMQKFTMLMYTSCGWFFSEISGIETIKILEYASRAIEIAEEITKDSIEEGFLKILSKANSNLDRYKNGKDVYLTLVKNVNVST
ncbi:MAG TPA: DUF3536 domain-containing protein [Ignavibacteria bacterium]|jgi:alpha-amylase/alpha-mannosidase (GH57 family)